MKDNWLVKIQEAWNPNLPDVGGLMDYIGFLVPYVEEWSQDLIETEHYSKEGGKPWLEVRDQVDFQETVVHFFNPDGEYLRSVNGNISKGHWRLLEATNKMIIELGANKGAVSELYELIFMNEDFFILQKHGASGKYLVLGRESLIAGMTWLEYVQLLFQTYRNKHRRFILFVLFVVLVVAVVFLLSILR